jgi:hypothetical protein
VQGRTGRAIAKELRLLTSHVFSVLKRAVPVVMVEIRGSDPILVADLTLATASDPSREVLLQEEFNGGQDDGRGGASLVRVPLPRDSFV